MKKLYHATPYENMASIVINGINPGQDGLVYLCETPEESARFVAIRGFKDIVAFEVKIPKNLECNIQETFDHDREYFQCRAFGYFGHIDRNMIEPIKKWNLP